jgi:hypothetical protein
MERWMTRPRRLLVVMSLLWCLLLALGACAVGQESVLNGESILSSARAAHLHDATFTMTLAVSTTTPVAKTLNESGSGTLTTNPYRQDIRLSGMTDGLTITVELLTDGQTLYTRAPDASTWQSSTAGLTARFLNYTLAAPQLIGQESVGGIAAWHLRGYLAGTNTTDVEDLWIRKSDSFPVKATLHAVDATSTAITAALTFTRWNTGVKITPPAPSVIAAT